MEHTISIQRHTRHGDGLPSNVGAADGSKASVWRRLVAPIATLPPSRAGHASVTGETSATALCDTSRHTKSRAVNAFSLQHLLRQQALDELLNDIREWRSASHPALRAFWRTLALHDIARFRRDHLDPERAAFEAAVERSKQRRAAA